MPPESAVWPIEKKMIQIYNADSEWLALAGVGKVYSSAAPSKSVLPYIVLGSTSERRTGVFGGKKVGFNNSKTIDLYSDKLGKEKCSKMYEITHRLFDGVNLTLDDGSRIILCSLHLVDMRPDPSGLGDHGIVFYDVTTRNA